MNDWPLGKKVTYEDTYNPNLLVAVPRAMARVDLGLSDDSPFSLPYTLPCTLPFNGVDIWNGWELSWLNVKGKPQVATACFIVPADSENIIESKSFKLYLNSLNQTKFSSSLEVEKLLNKDLSKIARSKIDVVLYSAGDNWPEIDKSIENNTKYKSLDDIDIEITDYQLNTDYLQSSILDSGIEITENLVSHLFKSNCMVTGQPDWATIFISYSGKPIDHSKLLQYLISYRNHQAFHEPCVEQVFCDIMKYCNPDTLSVYCRYTRRGGLDINPFRSTEKIVPSNLRIWRQ